MCLGVFCTPGSKGNRYIHSSTARSPKEPKGWQCSRGEGRVVKSPPNLGQRVGRELTASVLFQRTETDVVTKEKLISGPGTHRATAPRTLQGPRLWEPPLALGDTPPPSVVEDFPAVWTGLQDASDCLGTWQFRNRHLPGVWQSRDPRHPTAQGSRHAPGTRMANCGPGAA